METKMIEKNGYRLHFIKSTKFKTVFIKTVFWDELKNDELTLRNVLFSNLYFSSKNYPTNKDITKKKADLYGINLNSNSYRKSRYIFNEVNMSVIEDKYTEQGLISNALEFYFDIMLNPNVNNSSFDKITFDIVNRKVKSSIKMEKENPTFVSFSEYKKLLGNSYYDSSLKGNLDDLNKINCNNLYTYYKNFFKNNYIDILVIGNFDFDKMEKIIDKYFTACGKVHQKNDIYLEYSKEFTETRKPSSFKQSKLVMGGSLKNISYEDRKYKTMIFNIIFGNSPNSKLFRHIREKLSYAYNISSVFNRLDGMYFIHAGISKNNYDMTKESIFKELKNMQMGRFTKKEVENAKILLLSVLKEFDDHQIDILDYYFSNLYFDTDSIKIQKEKIKQVTKDDVIIIARKIDIDTILLVEEG